MQGVFDHLASNNADSVNDGYITSDEVEAAFSAAVAAGDMDQATAKIILALSGYYVGEDEKMS